MILDEIVLKKKLEIAAAKKNKPLEALKKEAALRAPVKPRFLSALRSAEPPAIIAEIKRKSPSMGILRKDFDPVRIARD